MRTTQKGFASIALNTLVAGCFVGLAAPAAAQLSASVGADYNTGKYGGATSTDVWYVPFVARYDAGPATFKLTVPWIKIVNAGGVLPVLGNGSGGVSNGVGGEGGGGGSAGTFGCAFDNRKGATKLEDSGPCAGFVTGTGATGASSRRSESGLGDVVAAMTYGVYNNKANGLSLDATGRIKFGTADEKRGLGSGKNDYAVQLDLGKDLSGGAVFASLGYKWLGDPDGLTLKNVTYGSLGGSLNVSAGGSLGASVDFASAAVSGAPRPLETSFYFTQRFSPASRLNVYLMKGLSDANPDRGGGLTYTHSFN